MNLSGGCKPIKVRSLVASLLNPENADQSNNLGVNSRDNTQLKSHNDIK